MANTKRKYLTKIIQPSELFKMMGIEYSEEAEKIFNIALSFIFYINEGDRLETPNGVFEKIGPDLIYLESSIDPEDMVQALEKRRILKFYF